MNKLYENELVFEQANAKTAELTSSLAPAVLPKDFVLELYCECANLACLERISITSAHYLKAKRGGNSFVIKPEHYLPEFERLLQKHHEYWIIAKKIEKLDKPFET